MGRFRFLELGARVDVRDSHGLQVRGAAGVVGEAVDPGVDGVGFGAGTVVEDVGAGQELVVGYFVAFNAEAVFAELED